MGWADRNYIKENIDRTAPLDADIQLFTPDVYSTPLEQRAKIRNEMKHVSDKYMLEFYKNNGKLQSSCPRSKGITPLKLTTTGYFCNCFVLKYFYYFYL